MLEILTATRWHPNFHERSRKRYPACRFRSLSDICPTSCAEIEVASLTSENGDPPCNLLLLPDYSYFYCHCDHCCYRNKNKKSNKNEEEQEQQEERRRTRRATITMAKRVIRGRTRGRAWVRVRAWGQGWHSVPESITYRPYVLGHLALLREIRSMNSSSAFPRSVEVLKARGPSRSHENLLSFQGVPRTESSPNGAKSGWPRCSQKHPIRSNDWTRVPAKVDLEPAYRFYRFMLSHLSKNQGLPMTVTCSAKSRSTRSGTPAEAGSDHLCYLKSSFSERNQRESVSNPSCARPHALRPMGAVLKKNKAQTVAVWTLGPCSWSFLSALWEGSARLIPGINYESCELQ